MALNNAQKAIVAKAFIFQRQAPELKLKQALEMYRRRVSHGGRVSPPEKLRVRVTYTKGSGRPFFVVQVRRSYIGAYSLDKLLEKIALGWSWNRVDLPCGVASGALERGWK